MALHGITLPARAVAETGLPEPKVRAVVEATLWFQVCIGATGVQGGDSEARVAGYLARFPGMFEGRDDEVITTSDADEAIFISETTDIFEDEVTRILASVRAYQADIDIIDTSAVVRVAGPTAHDLEQLFYLGSEKDPAANIGQYGEGFKAAAMCLVRDFGIHPVARSGDRIVCIRLSAESVAKTKLRPLVYDWFRASKPFAGTELVLPHAPPKLRAAMQTGLSHFLYQGNPLVGRKRWESYDGAFVLYDSPERGRGAIFYRNLRRAVVPDIPVVLVINKSYTRIEKLIQSDRDRNAFGEKLIKIFYEIFARSALKGVRDAQQIIVEAARPVWSRGHALLAAISEAGRFWNAWPEATARKVFGDRFYARAHPNNASEHLRFEAVEKRWQEEGREALPGYFAQFGVGNARAHLEKAEQTNLEESRRAPTSAEREAIDLLVLVLRDLAPEVHAIFAKDRTTYLVARTDEVLGALRKGRSYRSREVFLAERLFEGDFALALATFLHEHAHVFGHDGDRGFTDALTEILETVVRARSSLDKVERRWVKARARVVDEREREGRRATSEPVLRERLGALDEVQLRALLERIPAVVVERVLEDARSHDDEKAMNRAEAVGGGLGWSGGSDDGC